jgi:large subunit ribosomal protein L9
MAGKKIKLLLTRTVEDLGIVGDIVKVRPGYARNYLLPQALAEDPTPTKIERLKAAREAALAELSVLRKDRESLLGRMENVVITIKRSCNDQGHLYGSVSQRDISEALVAAGYAVDVRAVRLSQSVRRVGEYHVPIQLDKDLRSEVTLKVEPDRSLEEETDKPQGAPAGAAAVGPDGKPIAGAKGAPGRDFRGRRREEEVIDAIDYDYDAPPKPKKERPTRSRSKF